MFPFWLIGPFLLLLLVSPDAYSVLFVLDLHVKYSEGGPYTYVYCMVCHCVIAAPYVRNVVVSLHIITLLMTIWNAQGTMSSFYSLTCFHQCTKLQTSNNPFIHFDFFGSIFITIFIFVYALVLSCTNLAPQHLYLFWDIWTCYTTITLCLAALIVNWAEPRPYVTSTLTTKPIAGSPLGHSGSFISNLFISNLAPFDQGHNTMDCRPLGRVGSLYD